MAFVSTPLVSRRRSPASERVGNGAASGGEVRNVDRVDFAAIASTTRCGHCRKDRQKCTRKDPSQAKCDRCIEYDYVCSIDDANAPADGKRRRLQRLKCEACRTAKVKCDPPDRLWPAKCTRCIERGTPCSKPQPSSKKKAQTDDQTASTPKSVDESDDDSEPDVPIRNNIQAGPRTPGRGPTQDVTRPMRPPRRSMSDIVYETNPSIPPPQNTYKFEPLKDGQIRLLILQPGLPKDDVRCRLVTEHLEVARPYQALSYRWGDDAATKPIMIVNYSKPKPPSIKGMKVPRLYTSSNLFQALRELRHHEKPLTLYANALCIHHDDQPEKFAQSSRTQEIFNKASNVIVWLGTETLSSARAFGFIPNVLDMSSFDKLVKENAANDDWDALAELMRNQLFSRRWLIQELAVARKAVLRCGPSIIPWTDFSDAVALFEANLPEIQKYYKFSLASGGPINDIRALGASTLVSAVNNMIRKTPQGRILNRLDSMETLVSLLAVFEASDPLDTIIAVMGLAKDREQVLVLLKTTKTILDKFIDFVRYCANCSGNIDIILRHWAPVSDGKANERNKGNSTTTIQLPSWIPTVNGSAFGGPCNRLTGRVNGDSFVGLPNHLIYNASLGFPITDFSFGTYEDYGPEGYIQYDRTMTVKGCSLGRIAEIGPRAVQGLIPREWLEMDGWTATSSTVTERLWRTLVADRGPNNTKPPAWYHRACLHCLDQSNTNGDIDTTAILNQPKCSHVVADFLRRVQSVIWNRMFLRTEAQSDEDRLFGLAPGGTRRGDWIVILYGCSVPVILREHIIPATRDTAGDRYFEVIGQSFIYGMMDGEACERLSSEVEAETMTFKLC